jgi:hypothetical protein
VLYELAQLFTGMTGKGSDRRAHKRKTVPFAVRWLKDERTVVEGVGQEISPTGALVVLREKPARPDFTLAMKLGERTVTARVTTVRHDKVEQGGLTWHRFATKFAGIAADDWDAVVRFCGDEVEPENKAHGQIKEIRGRDDDAFRLLPLSIQRQIVEALVKQNQLAEPAPGQAPLLKMTYGGRVKRKGREMHRCHVHSRIEVLGEIRQYDTPFYIDDFGKVYWQTSSRRPVRR